MRILIACEESQAVTKEFRNLGHEAYSCDILPCSGGHPEWHLQRDVTELLKVEWDMIIAFPPCNHLAVSGSWQFAKKIADGRQQQGIDFFILFVNHACSKIAIENPIGIMSSKFRKPDQIIQPYQFGHPESKSTCLWLKGLPKLRPTQILKKPIGGWKNQHISANGKYSGFKNFDEQGKVMSWNNPKTQCLRSKTYQGIARAMAEQWG
jgi:hypothetical protein